MTKPTSARKRALNRRWHLAADEFEVGLSEFEFAIFHVAAAFERWQSDCLACCHGHSFSGTDTAMLHVIRMHERPKSISEIGRLLKRDDQANLQYGIRKLLKAGLIEKSTTAGSKKDVTYQVTRRGLDTTNQYAEFRRELLVATAQSIAAEVNFEAVTLGLNMMAAVYDQASCVAAIHRAPG